MTIRARLSDIALAIAGGAAGGGWSYDQIERYLDTLQSIADCGCGGAAGGGFELPCIPVLGDDGTVVTTNFVMMDDGAGNWNNWPEYDFVKANLTAGNWRLTTGLEAQGGESTDAIATVTQVNGETAIHTIEAGNYGEVQTYDFNMGTSGSIIIVGAGGGYPSTFRMISLCARPAGIETPVTLAASIPVRSDYGWVNSPPLPGRPFFGPFGWQPPNPVSVSGVAGLLATGIQSWAEGIADILDPTDSFIFFAREFSSATSAVLQNVSISVAVGDLAASSPLSFEFPNPILAGNTIMISLNSHNNAIPDMAAWFGANPASITISLVPSD